MSRRRADGGTLFLDGGDSADAGTGKAAAGVEYGELRRVGGSRRVQVNVRLIHAPPMPIYTRHGEGRGHFVPICSTGWLLTLYNCRRCA